VVFNSASQVSLDAARVFLSAAGQLTVALFSSTFFDALTCHITKCLWLTYRNKLHNFVLLLVS
ncbi:MAG: hypothetical protein ACX933_18155, partial [Marinobacter adhaerens]